jgi:GNAT superfamily N-acetyltransferase
MDYLMLEVEFLPIIRLAKPEDAAEIARLNTLFNGSSEPAAHYAARMQDPRRVDTPILAEVGGHCAGIASLRLAPQVFYASLYAELTELFVEEAFRRRGIGKALLLYAERIAAQAGAAEIVLRTGFRNVAAQQLYRACGFTDQDLSMSKPLQEVDFYESEPVD